MAVVTIYQSPNVSGQIKAYNAAGRGGHLRRVMQERRKRGRGTLPVINSTVTLAAVFGTSQSAIVRTLKDAGVKLRNCGGY